MKVRTKEVIHNHTLDEFDHLNLEASQIYEVIGLNDEYYRVIDKSGEPMLYPKYLFDIVDGSISETWIRRDYGPDEYYIDPPELCTPGFYEDYFDGKPGAKAIFKNFLASHNILP